MIKKLQRIGLFIFPTILGGLNLTHPRITPPIYNAVVHHLPWWTTLHLLNLILFPLLGLSGYLLVRDVQNFAATVSRVAIAIYVPIYAAFDALAGIGTGILVLNAQRLASNGSTAAPLIDAYWSSGPVNTVAAVGSIAWVIAMLSAAVAFTDADRRRLVAIVALVLFFVGGWSLTHLFLPSTQIPLTWWLITIGMGVVMFAVGKPRIPAALLTLAGSLFGASHVTPTGPLAMLCFLGAAALCLRISNASEKGSRRSKLQRVTTPVG
jgi:hypothetical protein